ncbi:tyrosine-type recombinase/integrase [Ruegeria arenilitoris]|nr:site-specific integrase [Ruegeria arenilitoris]
MGVGSPTSGLFIRDAKSFLRWLVAQDYIEHKFLMAFEDTIKKRKVEVDHRIYSALEVRALYNAADQFSPQWRDFLRFQLLTAQRHADVARMEWQHVDLAQHTWTQPANRTKNGRAHIVHLSAPALEILKAMQPQVGKARGLVFTTTTGGAMHHNNERNKAYFRNAQVEHGGRHAFRHTMVTLLAQCGHSEDVVDMALGHARKGVNAVYQKFQYLEQRADALDDWGQIVIGQRDAMKVLRQHRGTG